MTRNLAQYMLDYVAAMQEAAPMIADQWSLRDEAKTKQNPTVQEYRHELQRTRYLAISILPKVQRLEQALVIFAMIEHLFKEAASDLQNITKSEYEFCKLDGRNIAESFFYYLEAVLGLDSSVFCDQIRRQLQQCNVVRNHLVHEGLDASTISKRVRGAIEQFGGAQVTERTIELQDRFVVKAAELLAEVEDRLLRLEAEHISFGEGGVCT